MTNLEKIVKYMEAKRNFTSPHYLRSEDIDNLKNQSPNEIDRVWKEILEAPRDNRMGIKDCPFCILANGDCKVCLFKDHHGFCSDIDSDWLKYIIPSINRLINDTPRVNRIRIALEVLAHELENKEIK